MTLNQLMKLLFFCLISCNFSFSQVTVLDKITAEPIPYVHVRLIGVNYGIISDFNGQFQTDSLSIRGDSVLVSCLGYESVRTSIDQLKQANQILLDPISQEIDEVTVARSAGKFKRITLGITKKPKSIGIDPSITSTNGTIRATHIPNEHSSEGILKSAAIYITDDGFPDAHFRLHIYSVSELEIRPGKELTRTNIIASGTAGNEWIEIDLRDQRIVIPENGCFVGIEWFDSPKSYYYQDTLRYNGVTLRDGQQRDTTYTHIRRGNGIVLGSRSEPYKFAKNKLWYKTPSSDDWVNWCTSAIREEEFNIPDTLPSGHVITRNEENVHFLTPCINIEVSFPKEKIKPSLEPPKNRKVNKLERVKEDNFNFPQASVSELFNSLIKAFQEDEIVYVLKYLCVYADDELDELVSLVEENEQSAGDYFSPSEKERIIDHFRAILNDLSEESLTKIDGHQFKINANNHTYLLLVEDGKWKLNPYSRQTKKVNPIFKE